MHGAGPSPRHCNLSGCAGKVMLRQRRIGTKNEEIASAALR
jgi:hypothetical protein